MADKQLKKYTKDRMPSLFSKADTLHEDHTLEKERIVKTGAKFASILIATLTLGCDARVESPEPNIQQEVASNRNAIRASYRIGEDPDTFERYAAGTTPTRRRITPCSFLSASNVVLGTVVSTNPIISCEEKSPTVISHLNASIKIVQVLKGDISEKTQEIPIAFPYITMKGIPQPGDDILVGMYDVKGKHVAMPYMFAYSKRSAGSIG